MSENDEDRKAALVRWMQTPAPYKGLPRLPCWLTKACTVFRSLASTVQRSSRLNRSLRCAGSSRALSTPAFSTASGNLTGCAVPSTTIGVSGCGGTRGRP